MDQMERDHARDMETDRKLRELQAQLTFLAEQFEGTAAEAGLSEVYAWASDERARIVRRWD